jgi:hypothetical protein
MTGSEFFRGLISLSGFRLQFCRKSDRVPFTMLRVKSPSYSTRDSENSKVGVFVSVSRTHRTSKPDATEQTERNSKLAPKPPVLSRKYPMA